MSYLIYMYLREEHQKSTLIYSKLCFIEHLKLDLTMDNHVLDKSAQVFYRTKDINQKCVSCHIYQSVTLV